MFHRRSRHRLLHLHVSLWREPHNVPRSWLRGRPNNFCGDGQSETLWDQDQRDRGEGQRRVEVHDHSEPGRLRKEGLRICECDRCQASCQCGARCGQPSCVWKLDDEDFAGEVKDVENGQTLTYTSQPEHNGKTLSCVVNHKGYSEEALAAGSNKASVALDVRFKPVAATQPTNLYGMKIGEPFNVLMSFKSHPAPTEFHWKMQDGSEVPMGGSIKRFTAAMLEDGPHAGHFTAKLTINEVTKEDVESKNVLVVQNDLGETQYEFSLGVGQRPPVAGSNLDAGVPSIDAARERGGEEGGGRG